MQNFDDKAFNQLFCSKLVWTQAGSKTKSRFQEDWTEPEKDSVNLVEKLPQRSVIRTVYVLHLDR